MKFFNDLNKSFATFSNERKAIRQLQSLSDRELSDMGLSRGLIQQAVRHGVKR